MAERDEWEDLERRHTEILRGNAKEAADAAIKFLVLINGGAVIATTSFIATSDTLRESICMLAALVSFLIGLCITGCLIGFRYRHSANTFMKWVLDAQEMYDGKIDFDELTARNNARIQTTQHNALGAVAFSLFIVGIFLSVGFLLFDAWPTSETTNAAEQNIASPGRQAHPPIPARQP